MRESPSTLIFDPVGGEGTEAAFRTLAWDGRHLVVGFPAGIGSLRTNLPLLKESSLIGVNIAQFSAARSSAGARRSRAHNRVGRARPFQASRREVLPVGAIRAGDDCGIGRRKRGTDRDYNGLIDKTIRNC